MEKTINVLSSGVLLTLGGLILDFTAGAASLGFLKGRLTAVDAFLFIWRGLNEIGVSHVRPPVVHVLAFLRTSLRANKLAHAPEVG